MRPNSFITCLFSIFVIVAGHTLALAANASLTMVELPTAIHFLTPAGEDIEMGPGTYEVEAAESWLKLVPEGQGRAEAVLLEATAGTHDETVTEPAVRLEGEPDNPDVFHLGLLLADGTGLEAIGTKSGIRPRGLNLAFMQRATPRKRTFTQQPRVSQKSSPTIALQPGLTLPKLEGKVDTPPPGPQSPQLSCALSHEVIPGSVLRNSGDTKRNWPSQIHVAVFQNQLHVVSGITKKCEGLLPGAPKFCGEPPGGLGTFAHFIFDGGGMDSTQF